VIILIEIVQNIRKIVQKLFKRVNRD